MLTARVKIGDGAWRDTREHGLVYLSSDNRVGAPIKGFEETSYPEQEGVNISPKTVDDAFDYKVKFFIQTSSVKDANDIIGEFNAKMFSKPADSDVKTFRKVEFYNDYKHHKIVGYPQPISEATDFWRDPNGRVNDVVIVEWTIRVVSPKECDFNTIQQ